MSENMFSDCETVEAVLWALPKYRDLNSCHVDEALARIDELRTPAPFVVSEAARESAEYVLREWAVTDGPRKIATAIDRIIAALGATPDESPTPPTGEGRAVVKLPRVTWKFDENGEWVLRIGGGQ